MKYLGHLEKALWSLSFFVAFGIGLLGFGVEAIALVFSPVTLALVVALCLIVTFANEFWGEKNKE